MTDRDIIQRFEATAPRLLRLVASFGDATGRGYIIRQRWAYTATTSAPLDLALAYRGNRASARRIVREMGSTNRVDFCAWLYGRLTNHRCHVPHLVLEEALLALSEAERDSLALLLGGRGALAETTRRASIPGGMFADVGEILRCFTGPIVEGAA